MNADTNKHLLFFEEYYVEGSGLDVNNIIAMPHIWCANWCANLLKLNPFQRLSNNFQIAESLYIKG